MEHLNEVEQFIYECIEAIREKVYEDSKVDSKLILSKTISPILMDLLQMSKRGSSVEMINDCLDEEILVNTAILEVLKGIKEQSQLLFENDNGKT
jgi:hypothetical protein